MNFDFLVNPTFWVGAVTVVHVTVHAFLPNSIWDDWVDGIRGLFGAGK